MTETTTTASFHLELFSIESMFNRTDVEIIPKDNRLILVGENGSGKSTILNILYLFLTAQWKRLAKLPFRSVKARINGQDLVIRRDDIIASHRAPQIKYMNDYLMHRRRLTPDTLDAIITDIQELSPAKLMHDYVTLRYLAQKHEVDPDDLQEIFYLNLRMSGEVDSSAITRLQNLEKTIARLLPSQVLFLPTYRRIERDLKSIFPNLRLEQELKQFHRPGTSGPSCIELVEFGMKDVEETFAKKTQSLSESLRADLDNMTGSYLSDVIRKEYKKPDLAALIAPGVADAVNDVIDKIDARFLSDTDRGHLKQIMQTLQESRDAEDEQVTVHYLTKLAKVRANQQKREENVRAFVSLCNKYLQDKIFTFDSSKVEIGLHYVPEAKRNMIDETKKPNEDDFPKLPPDLLSSGEKQIVSLFSHIYLSGAQSYFVIIDEPELSISVPWQQRFLQDLIETQLCTGLIAVTHSPFIFENELSAFTLPVSLVSRPAKAATPERLPEKERPKGKRKGRR